MKYKLINSVTKIETLCDKVTIDGFDYYVSDEKPKRKDICITFTNAVYQNTQKSLNNKLVFLDKEIVNLHEILCRVEFEDVSVELPFDVSELKKVIATNNPNIDVPKVVDVFTVLEQWSKSKEKLVYQHWNKPSFMEGYNKSQETYQFSEEDMIEFGEWKDYNFYQHIEDNLYRTMQARPMYKVLENKSYTTKELLQIWKEQRPKIVYYG